MLLQQLIDKYGPEPLQHGARAEWRLDAGGLSAFHARLHRFYQHYAPEKLERDPLFLYQLEVTYKVCHAPPSLIPSHTFQC